MSSKLIDKKGKNYIYHMIREIKEINKLQLDSVHKSIIFCMESCSNNTFPSLKLFAQWVGCSISTLQRKLKDLEDYKIIERQRRKNLSNFYWLSRSEIIHAYEEEMNIRKIHKLNSGYMSIDVTNNFKVDQYAYYTTVPENSQNSQFDQQ